MSSHVNGSTNRRESARGLGSETATILTYNCASAANRRTSPPAQTLKRRWAELEDDVNPEVMHFESRNKSQQALLDCPCAERDDTYKKHAAIESQVALLTEEAESVELECLYIQDRLPATVLAL
jgi:hypothetical protein